MPNFWKKFLQKSDNEKKTIMWFCVIAIALIIIILWIICLSKGYIIKNNNTENNKDSDYKELKSELKGSLNEFKELDIKEKMSDFKQGYEELQKEEPMQKENKDQQTPRPPSKPHLPIEE